MVEMTLDDLGAKKKNPCCPLGHQESQQLRVPPFCWDIYQQQDGRRTSSHKHYTSPKKKQSHQKLSENSVFFSNFSSFSWGKQLAGFHLGSIWATLKSTARPCRATWLRQIVQPTEMVGLSTSQVDSADLLRADVEECKQKKTRGSHGTNGIFTYMNDMDPSI